MNKRMNKKNLGLIICFAVSLGGGSITHAFDGLGGYAGQQFPWFGHGNNGPAAYSLGNIPAPPYFALHPPVYYSHPTPRSYGHSPFACSCDCHHMGRQISASRVVENPFIQVKPVNPPTNPPDKSEKPVKIAAVPHRMANPFYEKPNREAVLGD